jgi:glycosyltransferase involved in cell wall biosynthesis
MNDLTLGILTYNAPNTLRNTLQSIFSKEADKCFNQIVVYVNPSSVTKETVDVIKDFNVETYVGESNKWIAAGFKWLVENSRSNNILLLEDDFFLIEENKDKISNILKTGTDLINQEVADVARLRSRKSPGNPLYSSWFAGQEHRCMTHLAECVHWRDTPHTDFPEHCELLNVDPVWYKFKSANANFTNNPCIFRKEFYKKHIIPQFCIDNTDIETAATSWWTNQDFTVITGDGLFCHDRLDGK